MSQVLPIEELRLSNGIPVVLAHLDGYVGTFHWWVCAGSTDEKPGEEGFAHFLEHMLFKDAAAKETGKNSTGETARAIESLGGDINAYTSFDQTVYHVTCAEAHWERVIDVFGTMAAPQRFLKSDFEREREVILEELRKGLDSPERQIYESLFSATYSKHPYGRTVIGFRKTLETATVGKLEAFYKRNYVSERMGIVLVGPIFDEKGLRRKSILKVLEKRFGKGAIPARKGARVPRPIEAALRKNPKYLSKPFDIKTPEFALSFRVPDIHHDAMPALEVLSGVLGMGESARLHQRLFEEQKLCTDVSASLYVPQDPGMFLLSMDLKGTADGAKAVAALAEQVRDIKTNLVTDAEVERVIANIESERTYSTQSVDGLANRIGYLRFILGDLKFDQTYLDRVRSVAPHDLRDVAREYLTFERSSGVFLQPKDEKPFEWPTVDFGTNEMPKVLKSRTKVLGKTAEVITRPSGMKVVHFERPGTAIASVHVSALGGLRLEALKGMDTIGASHMMAQTWTRGSRSMSARDIAAKFEARASSIDAFSGRNTVGMSWTCIKRDWKELQGSFIDVLANPTFPKDEIALNRAVIEDQIRSMDNHSSQVCTRNFLENLFEKHPYGRSQLGKLDNVAHHGHERLSALHAEWIHPSRLSVSVAGGVNESELNHFIEALEAALPQGRGVPTPQILGENPLPAPRWAYSQYGREQTHILVGGLGISMFDPRRYALKILTGILGGQSGRLFIELREKKSLAYSVAPLHMEGMESGYIGTYIACAPGKKDEALAGIQEVLEKFGAKGPTPKEMERAKNYLLGQRAMELQTTWSIASLHGLEALYAGSVESEEHFRKCVEGVKARDVQRLCQDLLINAPQVTAVVS